MKKVTKDRHGVVIHEKFPMSLLFAWGYWVFLILGAAFAGIHLYVSKPVDASTLSWLMLNMHQLPSESTPWWEAARLMGGLAAASFAAGLFASFDDVEEPPQGGKPAPAAELPADARLQPSTRTAHD